MNDLFDTTRPTSSPIFPAATVVPLRNGPDGLETLMLRRNSKLTFAGGAWVWPGGRIDPDDHRPDAPGDLEAAARRAAAREALEEADLVVDPDQLVWFAHWTPPETAPKRFATYFFAVAAPGDGDSVVTVDMGEIHEHRWIRPAEALRLRNAGAIDLTPPTWITLEQMATFASVDEVLTTLSASEPEFFATRFAVVDGAVIAMYDGDAGYDTEDPDVAGPRHRLTMAKSGWRYDRHA